MTHSKINRTVGAFVFLISITVFVKCLSDTVVFWDVGEFLAASYLLQVPHPPGPPLFLMAGRLFSLLPTAHDIAVRMHLMSALSSALASFFLYLSIVKLILLWKRLPETTVDKITLYGSAAIGALSLSFAPSFWFNAEEFIVFGPSMFLVAIITWLLLQWGEHADEPKNEKYILLISYILGLSIGVHLLALLVIFPYMLFYYFRKNTFTLKSFLLFSTIGLLIFFMVYPGIVKWLPGLLGGTITINGQEYQNVLISVIPYALIIGSMYGAYYTYVHKKKTLNLAFMSLLFILLGFSTYTAILIRASEHPPMNENDPSNLTRLDSYLSREQYGDYKTFPRRYSTEPQHQGEYTKYSSDWDFFWRYQVNHMYIRYFLWQYAGIEGNWQDAGVNWKQLYGIPLLIGFFGFYVHYKKDRKRWFVFLLLFLIMGIILDLYQNQQDPQPRERDYFYVGSFFAFSIWIGIGVMGLIDVAREKLKDQKFHMFAAGGILLLAALFVPGNMLRTNFKTENRTGDYMAWDYSYNLLQTCEPDAILFTNGDNDTFPVWYLQDVEGVRRDIRVVNLSLVNTPWYILQLKNETPFGAQKVAMSLTDDQIESLQPIQWEPRKMSLDVPRSTVDQFSKYEDEATHSTFVDTSIAHSGKINFVFPYTITFGNIKAIRVQDIATWDIISSNQWKRPIYFAVTSTPDSKIGLDKYFEMDGLAMKMVPYQAPTDEGIIVDSILTKNLYDSPAGFFRTFHRGYKYRDLRDSSVYYDENVTRMIMNYRNAFLRLALYHLNETHDNAQAITALDSMESKIPHSVIPMDYRLMFDVSNFYNYAGDRAKYMEFTSELEQQLDNMISKSPHEALSQYNPYVILLSVYEGRGEYQKGIDLLNKMQTVYAGTPGLEQQLKGRIAQLQAELAQHNSGKKDTVGQK
jgi:Protein O-mannosyl-transferase TMEM260-like